VRVRRIELAEGTAVQARALARTIRAFAPAPADLGSAVGEILDAVRAGGDAAVLQFSRRFDAEGARADSRVSSEECERAASELDPDVRRALETVIDNVRAVAEADLGSDVSVPLPQGQEVRLQEIPVGRAGAYVPGGRAAYPSTVVMCCVPAKVAGVEQVVVATPPAKDGNPNRVVLAACALCAVDEVFAIGGVQAIAALAFGTQSVQPVDVIVGPGNEYVQEAKRQVTGTVGIDGIEGPSELVVIADEQADPDLVALDLAAQAEHGRGTMLALLSASETLLQRVEAALEALWSDYEALAETSVTLVRVRAVEGALELANALAPEHLELVTSNAEELVRNVRTSGCVFLGRNGGAAFGDYAVGSNHVLPTAGAARFAGPLGVATFRRRQALVSLPDGAARALAPHVSSLARAEGFPVHAASAEARGSDREQRVTSEGRDH
jgi:histidinol dehydrogenase